MSVDTEVLVIGAGPVGLALAGDLGWRGRSCIVVEQTDGTIYQPRMDLVGVRTMEFCRRWGIVPEVEASPYPRDYPQDNVYLTSLNGFELGRERFPGMDGEEPAPWSPQKRERCPQNMFDPILRKFADSFDSVSLRYEHRLEEFREGADGVLARVRDLRSDATREIRAKFIVGCDGAKSLVRDAIGIDMHGNRTLTYTTNVIFRCDDLNALHDKDPGYRYIFIGTRGTWATLVAINGRDQWRMSLVGGPEPRLFSDEEIAKAIRQIVGRDFEFEVLTVVPWTRGELVADSYGRGRVFIAGDSCHVMSPTGGFGMNTGIADAVDLSWKLDAALAGWGGEKLLASYHLERRPVGSRNVTEASKNLKRMMSPGENPKLLDCGSEGEMLRADVGDRFSRAMRHEWYTAHIHLGYCYTGSPVVAEEGEEPFIEAHDIAANRDGEMPRYVPTTRPGCRAPHVWLEDGRSTLDLFGRGFVLVVTDASADDGSLQAAAERLATPLTTYPTGQADVREAYERPLVLVRPDGHVCWRGSAPPADPEALLRRVTGK